MKLSEAIEIRQEMDEMEAGAESKRPWAKTERTKTEQEQREEAAQKARAAFLEWFNEDFDVDDLATVEVSPVGPISLPYVHMPLRFLVTWQFADGGTVRLGGYIKPDGDVDREFGSPYERFIARRKASGAQDRAPEFETGDFVRAAMYAMGLWTPAKRPE